MFLGFLIRKLRFLSRSGSLANGGGITERQANPQSDELKKQLDKNLELLTAALGDSCDLKIHPFRFGPEDCLSGALAFIDGLVDNALLTEAILRPIKSWSPEGRELPEGRKLMDELSRSVLCTGEVKSISRVSELISSCLSGETVVLIHGSGTAIAAGTKGWEGRSVTEPQSETVVRGPREGFTENLRTNTALIRRKIKNSQLRVEQLKAGRKTQTDVALLYLSGVASSQVIDAVKYRISNLEVDSVLESGYIEEYIEDAPFSPFSTVGHSEKPDVIASRILEGRVAILVDGTPFVLTAPMLFVESFQTAEDYYNRPLYSSMMRILRFIAYFITIFAPSIYVALTAFHQELIPTTLLFTIANAREGTPFPVFIETLIMVFAFEILYEAGIRMPRPVGQAISIVGALVMGDAAVSAGLVGAPVVIAVAFTAVASFLVPAQNDSASLLRVAMMALAAFAGLYGVSMGFLLLLLHLGSLNSFGVPYFDGFAWTSNLQDSMVRVPLWGMLLRPKDIARGDTVRRRFFIPPLRPHEVLDEEDSEENEE